VDELAGAGAFVAADRFAGGGVTRGQDRSVVAAQDLRHRRSGDRHPVGDTQRPDPVGVAQPKNLRLDDRAGAAWAVLRPAAAINHRGLAAVAVSAGPARGGGVSDLETLGGAAQVPALVDDTPGQPQPPGRGEWAPAVDHQRASSGIGVCRGDPHRTRRPSPISKSSIACRTVTNVPGQHN
jgi:hypothetical protein